jgi:hypothetical protein
MLADRLQPLAYRALLNVFTGVGGVVNIAGVKTLMHLSDASQGVAIQVPDDFQSISLDRTLVDPTGAKQNLEDVLLEFLRHCGLGGVGSVLQPKAAERLVWCSAGVPRDFLWLVERAIDYAIRRERQKVGTEEVNQAAGDLAEDKVQRIEQEGVAEADELREVLQRLQASLLDAKRRRNCFLVRLEPTSRGYQNVLKLADLRLVHLINPGITPSKVGQKYEAYLLDYSFYTGVRKRHGVEELKIESLGPPKFKTLRELPKFDAGFFEPQPASDATTP